MKKLQPKLFAVFAALSCAISSVSVLHAAGGKIDGLVVNGTTNRPVANQSVQLLKPSGGMQLLSGNGTKQNCAC